MTPSSLLTGHDYLEIDRAFGALLQYSDDNTIMRLRRQVFDDLDFELLRTLRRPALSTDICEPNELTRYIHSCRVTLETFLLENIAAYTASRWLYYIRSLPEGLLLYSPTDTTWLYIAQLAEALTGLIGTKQDVDSFHYAIDETVLRRIVRFTQAVIYLNGLHITLHIAAKGVHFQFKTSGSPLPDQLATPEQKEALRLFDWRVSAFDQNPLFKLGTQGTTIASGEHRDKAFAMIGRSAEAEFLVDDAVTKKGMSAKFLSRYAIKFLDASNLSRLISDRRIISPIWSDEAGALLILLRIAANAIVDPRFRRGILTLGFAASTRPQLLQLLSYWFEDGKETALSIAPGLSVPGDALALLEQLEAMKPCTWPVISGPVVRCSGSVTSLDLVAATMRLNHAFEFPRIAGPEANARSEHFEESVQALLDASSWASLELRTLRRRTLRYKSKPVTDIDAIGAQGDKLLLVSCKSTLYAEYHVADYKIIRNASSTVATAIADWTEICAFLRAHPKGDNYDFMAYGNVVGLVCTPVVIYSPLGPATQMNAQGLYAAVSISELRAWLDGSNLAMPRSS